MRHTIQFLVIIFLLINTFQSHSENQKRELAIKLFISSGLEKDISHMPQIIKNRANKGFNKLDIKDNAFAKDYIKFVNELIDTTYSPKIYQEAIIENFEKLMNAQQLEQVIKWYQSPKGQKYIEAANKYYDPDKQKEFDLFVKSLEQDPPTKNRGVFGLLFIKKSKWQVRSFNKLII